MTPHWLTCISPRPTHGPVLLEWLSWPAIAELQETGATLLLLPVGATEQHGPHLPVNTDTIIANSVCAFASAQTGAPVLPAVNYGVSLGHTEKWPGTFSLFHETLIHTIREIASWAVATGWKRLIVVNGHCGNDASLRCAVDRLRFDFLNLLHIATLNSWQLTPAISGQFTTDAKDWHANEAETSLMQFLAPESVRSVPADDPDRTDGCVFPHMVANTSLNGVTGTPSKASAKYGAALFSEMGTALTDIVRRAMLEVAPLAWERNFAA